MRELRSELRSRLGKLAAQYGEVLVARFYGPLPRGADVENALLYNIDSGGATFAAAARCGVRFEHDRCYASFVIAQRSAQRRKVGIWKSCGGRVHRSLR